MAGTDNLALNTDAGIVKGITWLITAIKTRQPGASVVVTGLLSQKGSEKRIALINDKIAKFAAAVKVRYADPGRKLLNKDGTVDETCFDAGRPNEKGYKLLTAALQPFIN